MIQQNIKKKYCTRVVLMILHDQNNNKNGFFYHWLMDGEDAI